MIERSIAPFSEIDQPAMCPETMKRGNFVAP